MTQYRFKEGAHAPKGSSPDVVGGELKRLQERSGGRLLPSEVVKAARVRRSPLHHWFEWDDTQAAQQYRLEQARGLIRSVHVVYREDDGEEKTTRAFVNVREDDDTSYVDIISAMNDTDMREQVLMRAMQDFIAMKKKYGNLTEFARLFGVIEELQEEIPELIRKSA